MGELSKRIITSFILIGFLILLFSYGKNYHYILTIYCLSFASYYEWLRLTSQSILYIIPFLVLIIIIESTMLLNITLFLSFYIFLIVFLIFLTYFSRSYLQEQIQKHSILLGTVIFSCFFILMINFYPSNNTLPQQSLLIDNKHYFIIFISLVSFIDVSAYFFGKIIGKNKINSNISPNKTYEGYFGSGVSTLITFILVANYFNFYWTILDIILLVFFIIASFYGDFLMSMIKRVFNAKDTGILLPGHGGILDRLDSYFTTLPIFYVWFML